MTQQSKDIRATLGYKVDQQSVNAAAQANAKVALSMGGVDLAASALSADLLKLNPQLATLVTQGQQLAQSQASASTSASTLTSSLNNQKTPVQDLTALYKGLEDQARRAGTAQDVAANSGKGVGGVAGTGIASGFGTIRSLAGAAGLVAGNSQAGSTIAAVAGLTAVLGPAGAAIALLGAGLKIVTDNAERASKAIEATANAYVNAREAALKATRADLEQQLRDAQALEPIRRKAAEDTANELINFVRENPVFTFPVTGIVAESLAGLGGTLGGLQANAENAKTALEATENEIAALTAVLDENAAAAFTATQALLRQSDRALEYDQLTREEREKLGAQIERDIAVLQAQATAAGKGTDAFIELTAEIEALKEQGAQLIPIAFTYADALEAEEDAKKALVDQSNAIQKGIEEQRAAEDDLRAATELVTEAQQDLATALTEHREAQRQIILDMYAEQAKALTDRNEDEQTAREKAHESLEEQEDQHRKRIQAIHDRFAADETAAIGNRDALALYNAKLRRDEDLKRENEDNAEREKAIEKSLADQLKIIQKRYDDQLKTIRDAATKAINAEQQRYDKQQANLKAALDKAIAAEQYANNRLEALRSLNAFRAEYWAGVVEVANKRYADSAAALAVSLHQSANLISSIGGGGSAGFPPLSDGSGNILNGQSGNALVGGFNVGGGLGDVLSGVSGGSINVAAPRNGGGTFPSGGRAGLPSVFGGAQSKTIVFAPNIRSSMSEKQVRRIADDWFRQLRKMG